MKAVVLGDIGWKELYHLGDEAMTQAAVVELESRGFEVTLVAGDPSVSSKMYSVNAVGRVGFWSKEGSPAHKSRLSRLEELLNGSEDDFSGVVKAVKAADLAVIAGGGNLNDELPSHVYERLAFKRIAERFSIPLVVTSQTVGPNLSNEIRDAVVEIASYASVFGCRDYFSVGLVRSMVQDRASVYRQVDDASILEPSEQDWLEAKRIVANYTDDGPIAIGAFTSHVGTTDFNKQEYVDVLADVCREVSIKANLTILLTPHVGSFNPDNARDDQVVHSTIERTLSGSSARVKSLPMMKAGVVIALTRMASVSFSTRYHPAVFAMSSGVPHVGLIQSYYSSVKVRGALSNYGLARFGVPFIDKSTIVSAILSCRSRAGAISELQTKIHREHKAYLSKWWDLLCSVSRSASSAPSFLPVFNRQSEYFVEDDWSLRTEAQLPMFEQLSRLKSGLS